MKRVLLDATSLKISRPGFDVDTASAADLLLYLGVNFGQILEMGLAFLPQQALYTPAYHRAATIDIGPYDVVPETFVCGVTSVAITVPPHYTTPQGGLVAQFDLSYNVSETQLYIAAHPGQGGSSGYLADHALYIIYRREF